MSDPTAAGPVLVLDDDGSAPQGISVRGIAPDILDALRAGAFGVHRVRAVLRVRVATPPSRSDADLPDILGSHRISQEGIQFVPDFPFDPGVAYRAIFDPRPLEHRELVKVLTLEFRPAAEDGPAPEVLQVHPTSETLPENLLRFYVVFSRPMQRGRFDEQIRVVDADGNTVPDVLYRAPLELWDTSMRCLTVLLDPGRLKRGVGPNRALGPPLAAGHDYALAIGSGMVDAAGRPLAGAVLKRFRVAAAVREPVSTEQWQVTPPSGGSTEPLRLKFPRPLDWAMLAQGIQVVSRLLPVAGRVVLDEHERRWSFTPSQPWQAGRYRIRVSSDLEDVCGNDLLGAFDRAMDVGAQTSRASSSTVVTQTLGFTIA